MSLHEKIGQILMVGFEGTTLEDETKRLIEEEHIGGVILFSRNVENPKQLLALMNEIKKANSNSRIPLFLSVDEEGGRVSRMPNELIKTPTSRMIGQRNDKEYAYNIGNAIGGKIKAFGFNMNFAPILDIDSNPKNPVIGDRSFGASERIVSEMGIAIMKGLQEKNVISVIKHFPGHGDTSVDSHIGLPNVDKDLDSLNELEIIPFKKAIEEGADAVMVAHILFNKIDPQNPATLSKSIISDLLRNQLNYDGVVVTDDMTMGAITENYDIREAAVKAIEAGNDIILVCHGDDYKASVLEALKEAVENNRIPISRIEESVYRILKLKRKYGLSDDPIEIIDVDKINEETNAQLTK